MQLELAKSTEEIQEILSSNDYSFRFDCGYTKADRLISVNEIQSFQRAVWLHYTVYRVYGEIQQLREGIMNTLNFGHLITTNNHAIRSFFIQEKYPHLSAAFMQEIFLVQYSPEGSNDRIHEEAVVMNWFDFLQDCEGTNVRYVY